MIDDLLDDVPTNPDPEVGSEAVVEAGRKWWQVSRWLVVTSIVMLAVAAALWVVVGVQAGERGRAMEGSAVSLGRADAPVVLDIYLDFLCPACATFEQVNGQLIADEVAAGRVRARVHPMNFLDPASNGTLHSSRTGNAFVVVSKAEPDKALMFARLLFANQPGEGADGLTDAEIVDLASEAGVSEATSAQFVDMEHQAFLDSVTETAIAGGVTATPTVLVNGVKVDSVTKSGVFAAALRKELG